MILVFMKKCLVSDDKVRPPLPVESYCIYVLDEVQQMLTIYEIVGFYIDFRYSHDNVFLSLTE